MPCRVPDTRSPVPNVQVFLTEQSTRVHVFFSLKVLGRADESGRFSFAHVPAALGNGFLLMACGSGHAGWIAPGTLAGAETKDVVIRVRPGHAATVRVIDPQGSPVVGAEVSVGPMFDPPNHFGMPVEHTLARRPEEVRALCLAVTDAQGEVRFPHLPSPDVAGPCVYSVLVLRDDFTAASDVDVLVEFEAGKTPGLAFFRMQDQLGELLGRRVDLNTPRSLSRYFRDEVLREARDIHVAA